MSTTSTKLSVSDLDASYGDHQVLHSIDMDIPAKEVTALIGPSGCGKSTYLRCLNRMHELTTAATVNGTVQLDGADIYHDDIDPVLLRRHIGMVFQKPAPFPTWSIADNVLAGLKLTGGVPDNADEVVEKALKGAALWEEVKDKLDKPGTSLSGGQQQRLCIARAITVEPDVLLMDEPCSAIDPVATARVENLIHELGENYTIVVVTHNMQQAARISDKTAFLMMGELVEFDETSKLFSNPAKQETEDYITGKFG